MKYLEYTLPQNVVVSYELAKGLERFLAGTIDLIVLGILSSILSMIGAFGGGGEGLILLLLLPVFLYTWFMEYVFNGITLGKLALGIRVVHFEKNRLSVLDTFGRWVFRFVDIWLTLSVLGMILISGGEKGQRIGGLVTNTYVIKSRSSRKVNLHGLMKIATIEDHVITFKNIRSMLESDMILIKRTLDRHTAMPNEAHREAVQELAKQAAMIVQADEQYLRNPVKFLRLLLKDYIVLTR